MAQFLYDYVGQNNLRYIAQLLSKKLWCTVSNVSTAQFTKL